MYKMTAIPHPFYPINAPQKSTHTHTHLNAHESLSGICVRDASSRPCDVTDQVSGPSSRSVPLTNRTTGLAGTFFGPFSAAVMRIITPREPLTSPFCDGGR
jgi:hypothetical protein